MPPTSSLREPTFGEVTARVAGSPAEFKPQLDGLRAFAVAAVLIHHLGEFNYWLPGGLTFGSMGVHLFFVLSGFLITGLLLDGRDAAEAARVTRRYVLRQFYIRRFLRIFPLYYAIIAIAFVATGDDVTAAWPWLLTYTYNFWVASLGYFPDLFAHFWSLCVEEQFYLLWPFAIVFAPRRSLPVLATLLVALAVGYRVLAWQLQLSPLAFFTPTPASLDSLGIGALAALAQSEARLAGLRDFVLRRSLTIGTIALIAMSLDEALTAVLGPTAFAAVCVGVVLNAARGIGGIAGRVLEWSPLLRLGKISYGVYVYHVFVPEAMGPLLKALGAPMGTNRALDFLVYASLSIAIAALSWNFFEYPINRLKHRFPLGQ